MIIFELFKTTINLKFKLVKMWNMFFLFSFQMGCWLLVFFNSKKFFIKKIFRLLIKFNFSTRKRFVTV